MQVCVWWLNISVSDNKRLVQKEWPTRRKEKKGPKCKQKGLLPSRELIHIFNERGKIGILTQNRHVSVSHNYNFHLPL